MSAIIGTAVKGNEAGSAVSSPANITDVVNSFQVDGTTNVITWQNIAIWLGARAAADVANVKLATLVSGVVPGSQLPFTGFEFKGDYNPATNTPTLANTDIGKTNWVYRITGSANPTARDFGAGLINCSDDEYLAYSGDSGAGAWINIGKGATKQVGEGGTGATTAAGARTNLDLYSTTEVDDRTNASDASSTTLQKYTANGSNKWDLRGDGRRLGTHVRQPYAGGAYFQELNTSSIADAAIVTVSSLLFGSDRGYLQVIQASGAAQGWAQLVIESSAADPAILHDRHSKWSTTKDTASKINIYRDGADSNTLKIQNNTGASILLSITMHGHYLA